MKKQMDLLGISRVLTPEHRADLLAWVQLACFAENSVRKSLGLYAGDGASIVNTQEYTCGDILQRSKK